MSDPATFREQTRATKYQQKFTLPPNFEGVLKEFTREVLRQQPLDIYEWAANYFKHKALEEDGVEVSAAGAAGGSTSPGTAGGPPSAEALNEVSAQLEGAFGEYDEGGSGRLYPHLLKRVLTESAGLTATQALFVLSNPGLSLLADGTMDYRAVAQATEVAQQVVYLQNTGYDFDAGAAADATVHGMTREELTSELGSVFASLDAGSTGRLPLTEYGRALSSCPLQLSARDINLLILEAPIDGDGSVPWEKLLHEKMFGLICLSEAFTAFAEG